MRIVCIALAVILAGCADDANYVCYHVGGFNPNCPDPPGGEWRPTPIAPGSIAPGSIEPDTATQLAQMQMLWAAQDVGYELRMMREGY